MPLEAKRPNQLEATLLGQQIAIPTEYSPLILVPIPRHVNREIYQIDKPEELFRGYDTWHAYEASFLTQTGLPVCGLLKIVYSALSPCIIESKSLKLYLNSLNMTRLGEDVKSGIQLFTQIVQSDLQQVLHTPIEILFFEKEPDQYFFDFNDYFLLEEDELAENIVFSDYNENPEILAQNLQPGGEIKACSHLLRSKCKITDQPDWGSIYIRLKADRLPDRASLLKYIVSLRNENHFHEEICEMTYKRLWDRFHPEILSVSCVYTRRGGIDICPSRANKVEYLPEFIHDPEVLTRKILRQ